MNGFVTDYTTHFVDTFQPRLSLCGAPWDMMIMNDRPPTCEACKDIHAEATGWSFPLPEVVS